MMPRCSSPAVKWLGFVTAIWVQAIAGNNYTFSNYSHALKSLMSLSQLQLNNLSVAKDIGKAFGLISGFASDALPTSWILVIGAVEGLIGYGAQWLVVSKHIAPLPYWQMCIFMCLGGNSTTWMNTAVLVTCMRNFPKNQGPVSGILKGYVGLSTAIFTDICSALFASVPSSFLLMLTIVPAVICLISAAFLHPSSPATRDDERDRETGFLNILNVIAVIMATYLLAFDLSGDHHSRVISLAFAGGLVTLLALPLVVPFYLIISKKEDAHLDIEQEPMKQPLLIDREASVSTKEVEPEVVVVLEPRQKPVLGEDHTIVEMMRTVDFWVLFLSFLCGVGTGMCVINNMGQMGPALGYSNVAIFVSLTSIWGFFGRIVSGMVSEHYIWKYAVPRPLWNAASQIIMAIGYVIMALALPGSFYIGSILVGVCFGVRLTVTVPFSSELFGLKSYGLVYNILILNLPLGSFLFSGLLAGYLYDAQAAAYGGGNTCVGPQCYMLVYLIMAVACIVGFGLDTLLAIRTKDVYLRMWEEHKSKVRVGDITSSKS